MGKRQKSRQLSLDSITGVNPVRTHGLGRWGNPRVVFGVRVDKKLALAFTKVAKAKFGSTCIAIEAFMASVVGCSEQLETSGVNPSITIDIGEIKIERNLRERRKLTKTVTIEEETETTETLTKCGFKDCKRTPVGKGVYLPTKEPTEIPLCAVHLEAALENRGAWKVTG